MRFVKIIEAFYTRTEFWHEIQSQLSLLLSDGQKLACVSIVDYSHLGLGVGHALGLYKKMV